MEAVYQPEAWRDLFVMIGATAGALVGLLFVVMSLHVDKISDLPDHNMRATMEGARYNILHLLTVMVEAAVVLIPQPVAWMAVQLTVINLGGVTGLMPVTGLTLPFFSAGGTSLFVSMTAAGLLLNVARRAA